ncbi:MAG: pilus assembly protein [Cohaesibacter sp.]|jgi:Flp pilus assembly protein TadG|nr:pilus assembly protein [Cohaesibacter sp.]
MKKPITKPKLVHLFSKFKHDSDGAIAIQFALLLTPAILLAGAAVDYSRMSSSRAQFQDAADTAALAAARATTLSESQKQKLANKIFEANLPKTGYTINGQNLKPNDGGYTYTAHGSIDATLLKLAQFDKLDFAVKSTAASLGIGAEISLVFDVTASMGFGQRWRDATEVLIKTLENLKRHSGKNNFYVSLLPMGDRMKLPKERSNWLSQTPKKWDGCVEVRPEPKGGKKYRLSDTPPSSKPFVAQSDKNYPGYNDCPNVPLTGPTNDLGKIEQAANSLRPQGTGRFDIGMAWAFRTLSPKWRSEWDISNYPARKGEREKIVVLMTDGNTNAYVSTYPKDRLHQFGGHYGNRGTKQHFKNLADICKQMKKQDIKIHTVWVKGNSSVVPYLEKCATSPKYYHEVHNAKDLENAMSKLGVGISKLRLTE